jgi:transcriptional regulator with XRE-family HTH domain
MDVDLPFGRWLKRRRVELRLTQAELARRVSYSIVTIRKIESEELRPSLQITERLAEQLGIAAEDRAAFVRFARGEGVSNERIGEITKSTLPDRWSSVPYGYRYPRP